MSPDTLRISLPHFDYMSQKNTYSGSQGRFRYKFFPGENGDGEKVLNAAVYADNCYEVEAEAGRVTAKEFPYSEEGTREAEAWIREQYVSGKA